MVTDYIGRFKIDISYLYTINDVKNEIYDKIYYQMGVSPELTKDEMEFLESIDPVFWNEKHIEIEELYKQYNQDRFSMDPQLIERDINQIAQVSYEIASYIKKHLLNK